MVYRGSPGRPILSPAVVAAAIGPQILITITAISSAYAISALIRLIFVSGRMRCVASSREI